MLSGTGAPCRAHIKKGRRINIPAPLPFSLSNHQVIANVPMGVGNVTPNDVGVLTLTMGAACG